MTKNSEVCVTLSEELQGHLRGRAAALKIPLESLVAGLLCDTIESFFGVRLATPASTPGLVRMSFRPRSTSVS
jgi:hypothetical protein